MCSRLSHARLLIFVWWYTMHFYYTYLCTRMYIGVFGLIYMVYLYGKIRVWILSRTESSSRRVGYARHFRLFFSVYVFAVGNYLRLYCDPADDKHWWLSSVVKYDTSWKNHHSRHINTDVPRRYCSYDSVSLDSEHKQQPNE